MLIEELKGIGEKRAQVFYENGISDTDELVRFLPNKYIDMRNATPISEIEGGTHALIKGIVSSVSTKFITKTQSISFVKITDEKSGTVNAIYFNSPYIRSTLKTGKEYLFFGAVSDKGGKKIINPIFEPSNSPKRLKGIMPIYRKLDGIPATLMKSLISQALEAMEDSAVFTNEFCLENNLIPFKDAFKIAHEPPSIEKAESALRSISMFESVQLMFAYRVLKKLCVTERTKSYKNNQKKIEEFINSLDFTLSESQQSAVNDILTDLNKPVTMNRMIAGDVGSGKTICALIAMYNAHLSGYQSALMSPTEILARQHYKTAIKYFAPLGLRIGFFTGSLNKNDRESVLFDIRNGVYDIIIGTHTLFQEAVKYDRLGLVITDELHRFGVAQRSALESKGNVDVLVMSATPLPRTLALIYYSDLEVSYLKYPEEKLRLNNVVTSFVPEHKVDDMFQFMKKEGKSGRQSFIICPRIHDDEENEELVAAETLYKTLKKGVYKDVSVGLLHGQMNESEKGRTIDKFNAGELEILVSTTVVEVGIDVQSAGNIAIFGAERFGLSQLHQLRGRVGRDGKKAYCFLITATENEKSLERLNILKECNDAFELSEYDLKMRGAGDFIGLRQSGKSDLFFQITREQVEQAQKIVDQIPAKSSQERLFTQSALKVYGKSILNITIN